MKKVLLVAAVLLSSVAVSAQHAVGSFTLQPKVGINIANLTDLNDAKSRVGLAAGVEGEYQVSDIFSLSAGVIYSMQGGKSDSYNTSIDIIGTTYNITKADATMKYDYINIPIMANVYVAKGLAVKLGIQPGFNVNAKETINDISIANINLRDYSKDPDVKSVDFSIPVGLSYEYSNFVLDARYNWGLTKIADHSDSKNSVFQITVGYKFDL